jgi:hypothetical protein
MVLSRELNRMRSNVEFISSQRARVDAYSSYHALKLAEPIVRSYTSRLSKYWTAG